MTIPSRVLSVDGELATVECFGVQRDVSTILLSESLAIGDYVTVMANAFVLEKIPADVALESLAYLSSVLAEPESDSVR